MAKRHGIYFDESGNLVVNPHPDALRKLGTDAHQSVMTAGRSHWDDDRGTVSARHSDIPRDTTLIDFLKTGRNLRRGEYVKTFNTLLTVAGMFAGAKGVKPKARGQFVTRHGTSVAGARKILADQSLLMPSLATQRRDSATLDAVTFLTKQPELLPARRLTFTSDARTAIMPELRERLLVHPSEESALESLALKDYLSSLAMGDKEARRRGIGALVPPGGEQAARMALPIDPGRGWYTETKVYDRIPIRDTVLLVDRDSTSASRARNNYEARQRMRALGVDPGNPPPLSARRKAQTELMREAREAGLTVIPYGESEQLKTATDALDASGMLHEDAKGGNVRSDAKGGDASGVPAGSSVPPDYRGPRIVINPSTFRNEKDAACVMWNEGFRIAMEDMGFEPVSEPTDEQRKFFSDTAYANDELQLRRTILARVCTCDTSVKRPTDEQLQEAVEFLENVMEAGYPQNEGEQSAVQRIHDVISQVPMGQQEEQPPEEQPPEEQPPEEQPPEEQPAEVQADTLGGETLDEKTKIAGAKATGFKRVENVDAVEEAAHDKLLAQREEGSMDDSTRHERLELGSPEAETNTAALAQAAPAQVAPAQDEPYVFPNVGTVGGKPVSLDFSFGTAPAQEIRAPWPTKQAFREVLNTPIGTPVMDVKKRPGTPGAWQGGRYGVKKDEPGLPNSWKGGRY